MPGVEGGEQRAVQREPWWVHFACISTHCAVASLSICSLTLAGDVNVLQCRQLSSRTQHATVQWGNTISWPRGLQLLPSRDFVNDVSLNFRQRCCWCSSVHGDPKPYITFQGGTPFWPGMNTVLPMACYAVRKGHIGLATTIVLIPPSIGTMNVADFHLLCS